MRLPEGVPGWLRWLLQVVSSPPLPGPAASSGGQRSNKPGGKPDRKSFWRAGAAEAHSGLRRVSGKAEPLAKVSRGRRLTTSHGSGT